MIRKISNVALLENHLSESTHQIPSWRPQRIQMWLLWRIIYSMYCQTWGVISKLFMKVIKTTKCCSCGNHLLGLLLIGFISKHTKISNVNIVENHLLKLVIWEFKWKSFMKLKMISIVTLVENYFFIIITWKPFMNAKDFKCDSCEILIIFSFSLPESTHQRSQRFLMWFMLNFFYSSWLQHSTLSLICIDDFLRSL